MAEPEKKKKEYPKIGIIGVGILGNAARVYYEEKEYQVFCYDKFKNIGSVEDINKADIIFICVPTSRRADNKCDISIVEEAVGYIEYINNPKIVIIRSTVPPFTTDNLQNNHPKHLLLFNPEFLKARSAYIDFRNPTFQLVGYTLRSETVAQAILGILPLGRFTRVMPATAAEMFKYVRNSFLGVKNSFYNQIFDLCQAVRVDYHQIKECAEVDPWIGREHLDVMMDGYRGFNGMCLPKDTEAFLIWAKEKGVDLTILKQAVEFNSALLASQNIKKDS